MLYCRRLFWNSRVIIFAKNLCGICLGFNSRCLKNFVYNLSLTSSYIKLKLPNLMGELSNNVPVNKCNFEIGKKDKTARDRLF